MKTLYDSIKIFVLVTVITGILYPLCVWLIAAALFKNPANGSLLYKNGTPIGSVLIGQKFTSPCYFHSRPSVVDYNPMPSGASNLSLGSQSLVEKALAAEIQFRFNNHLSTDTAVPSEMLFSSGSGVDPHISARSAILQADRISAVRKFSAQKKQRLLHLISSQSTGGFLSIQTTPIVNVLLLNLALDELDK